MPYRGKIPPPTVKRLCLYLRELEALRETSGKTISSRQLGEVLGLTDAQVRKDLAYFGQFGQPGVGYDPDELISELRRILGTDREWRIVIVGAGNIGSAVASYGRLGSKGFSVEAVFDQDPSIIGADVAGVTVRSVNELARIVREREVTIGMVAVPGAAAQEVADALIQAGVRGLLNFAPVRLNVPDSVAIVSVDLSVSLEQLAFKISLGLTGTREDRGVV